MLKIALKSLGRLRRNFPLWEVGYKPNNNLVFGGKVKWQKVKKKLR